MESDKGVGTRTGSPGFHLKADVWVLALRQSHTDVLGTVLTKPRRTLFAEKKVTDAGGGWSSNFPPPLMSHLAFLGLGSCITKVKIIYNLMRNS